MAELDPDQEAALRRLRAAFGFVEVLRIVDHEADQDQDRDEDVEEYGTGGPAGRVGGLMPGPKGGKPRARPRRRAEPAPVAWLARRTLAQHSHLTPSPAPRRTKITWPPLRPTLLWLAMVAVIALSAVWLWRHTWLLIEAGRGVRDYLDGWAIDVANGFGLVERAKIALAFGLPILAVGVILSVLWAAATAVVITLGRRWRRWRVHWRRPF